MTTIPSWMGYVLGGGLAAILLKESIGFIKWAVERLSEKKKTRGKNSENAGTKQSVVQEVNVNPGAAKSSNADLRVDFLEKIYATTSETNKQIGVVALEVGGLKERVSFMAKMQGDQNGDLKDMEKAMTSMKDECAKRLLSCEKRFSGLHEKIVEEVVK